MRRALVTHRAPLMRRTLLVLSVALLLGGSVGAQVVAVSRSVAVGEPVVMLAIPPAEGAVARLVDPAGVVVCDAPGFVVGTPAGIAVQAFLLAVGSTGGAGEYSVEVIVDEAVVLSRLIDVTAREFRYEEIELDSALSDLRANWNPEKDREARELLALLASFNHDSLYHFSAFGWPIGESRITSWYGDRRTYIYSDGERANAIHFGLDLGAPVGATPGALSGAEVLSSGAGKVVFADMRIVTGNSVVVEHLPGVFSIYYHLDSVSVSVGEIIDIGDVIGTVGMTGLATGPHLHWEFRVRGIPVEPEIMVSRPLLDIRALFSTIITRDTPEGVIGTTERR